MSGSNEKRSARPSSWALFKNNKLAFSGAIILTGLLILALLVPLLPVQSPIETDPAQRLLRPLSDLHILGTDHLGRDMLSRLLWGMRTSIAVGFSATLVAALIGSAIGLVAGYAGRLTDNVMMRGIDMLMAFPYILLALAIVAVLGPGLINALYAIAIVNIPFFARNIRGVSIGLAHREFVDAARLSGKSNLQILGTEILPNVLPTIVITMSTTVGWMILETAGLSFLGLGAQPPDPDLGAMLGEGRKVFFTAPHVSIIPGIMIFLLVMSINLVGDGIRDVLDPRLKAGALSRSAASTAVERIPDDNRKKEPTALLAARDLKTDFAIGTEVYKAVGGVSFELSPGECLGLVGESGSGKSVTAMSLLGLVPTPPGKITGGNVMYRDEDLLEAGDERLRQLRGGKISYIFQDPLSTLHPLFTVGDQIAEAVMVHQNISYKLAMDKAIALLKEVRIPNPELRAKCYPHELSGGMRQRICIAMSLANEGEILIADEPTTALDVTVQAQILKLMRDLQKERGASLIFITHDFGVVSEICDRVAVMYAGKIVELGTTDDILNNPAHPYTHQLIKCVPVIGAWDKKLDAIPGLPPVVNNLPIGCAFADRCNFAEDKCRETDIQLVEHSKDRFVRCVRSEEAIL